MKKKLMMALSLVLVAAMSIGGTIAYLTAQTEAVTNTFTIGNITMTLDEAALNDDGTENAAAERVTANTYKIVPGATIVKDPTVHIGANSEPCYVYVCINDELNATVANSAAYDIDDAWVLVTGTTNIYRYNEVVGTSNVKQDLEVFDGVTFNGTAINATNYQSLSGKTIKVDAFAHQSEKVAETVADQAAIAHFNPAP